VSYPSGSDPYPHAGAIPQSGNEHPYAGAPGYPPQPTPPYSQPGYPPQQGYPPQPSYQPAGYAQPAYPPQAAAPYGAYAPQQPMQAPAAAPARKARNPMARAALVYGILSLGANIVGLFFGFYLTGILAVFAIYYGIRAIVYAMRLPGKAGLGLAITGIVLSGLSLAITVLGYASR
jgi:hypothetical protein